MKPVSGICTKGLDRTYACLRKTCQTVTCRSQSGQAQSRRLLQLRRDRHQVMKVTIRRIRNRIPAAIARDTIHVQTSSASLLDLFPFFRRHLHRSHVFQHFPSASRFLASRAASSPFSKYTNPFVRRSVDRYLRIFPLWRLAHRVARYFRLSCRVASVYDDVLARGKRCTG